MSEFLSSARNNILYKMYVHNVSNRLREMETPSDIDCQRWPWELMQNAKDSISGSNRNSINIILKIEENSVIFQHDVILLHQIHIMPYYINIQKEKQIIQNQREELVQVF